MPIHGISDKVIIGLSHSYITSLLRTLSNRLASEGKFLVNVIAMLPKQDFISQNKELDKVVTLRHVYSSQKYLPIRNAILNMKKRVKIFKILLFIHIIDNILLFK